MATFLKLNLCNDESIVTVVEAETLQHAVQAAFEEALANDQLEACHGTTRAQALSHDANSVQWAPGDGGQYTLFLLAPNTPEGQATIDEWIE